MTRVTVITIGIDPEIHLGPLTLGWHGVTIVVGWIVTARRGASPQPASTAPF